MTLPPITFCPDWKHLLMKTIEGCRQSLNPHSVIKQLVHVCDKHKVSSVSCVAPLGENSICPGSVRWASVSVGIHLLQLAFTGEDRHAHTHAQTPDTKTYVQLSLKLSPYSRWCCCHCTIGSFRPLTMQFKY